jgi:hypothetical protein
VARRSLVVGTPGCNLDLHRPPPRLARLVKQAKGTFRLGLSK